MEQAKLVAQRSEDPECKVGATIVTDENVIISTGYNSMPQNKDSVFTWNKDVLVLLDHKKSFGRYNIIYFLIV